MLNGLSSEFITVHNVFNIAIEEKSIGFKSGLLGGQNIGPAQPIHQLGNLLFKARWTFKVTQIEPQWRFSFGAKLKTLCTVR